MRLSWSVRPTQEGDGAAASSRQIIPTPGKIEAYVHFGAAVCQQASPQVDVGAEYDRIRKSFSKKRLWRVVLWLFEEE